MSRAHPARPADTAQSERWRTQAANQLAPARSTPPAELQWLQVQEVGSFSSWPFRSVEGFGCCGRRQQLYADDGMPPAVQNAAHLCATEGMEDGVWSIFSVTTIKSLSYRK